MKKLLVALCILLFIAGITGTVYFYIQYDTSTKEKETLIQQNAVLQSTIDAIGPVTTAYTVAAEVDSRRIVHEEDFVEITVPVSSITEDTVTNLSTIVGKLYKVKIQPGTTMTNSLVMDRAFSEDLYELDMTFDYLPLGLEVGDFINVVCTLPFGQRFMVASHLRVENVVETTNIVKVFVTPAQQELWTSAMKDKALYSNIGLSVLAEKYVEPGVSDKVSTFYPVRTEMESVVALNPNIKNIDECVNSKLREQFDLMLENIEQETGSALQSGNTSISSMINSSISYFTEERIGSISSGDTIDLNSSTSESMESLEGYSQSTNSINQEQKDKADGGGIFGDEVVLE